MSMFAFGGVGCAVTPVVRIHFLGKQKPNSCYTTTIDTILTLP